VRVWLDRPERRNAFDAELIEAVHEAFASFAAEDSLRAVLLAGRGASFCAGADLDWMRASGELTHERNVADAQRAAAMFAAVDSCPVPVVARVHGAALGGGCEVVLSCDLSIAAESATLGLPEIGLGVFPPLAAVLLPRTVGRCAAAEALLLGETLPAAEAVRLGLCGDVVPDAELDARVAAKAARAAALSGTSLRRARKALRRGAVGPLDDALRAVEEIYLNELMRTADATEGLQAWIEKRPPHWRHR
jgi:methylglutaconyl-CoA hydratase